MRTSYAVIRKKASLYRCGGIAEGAEGKGRGRATAFGPAKKNDATQANGRILWAVLAYLAAIVVALNSRAYTPAPSGVPAPPKHIHWTTLNLDSHRLLKYAAVPAPRFRELILRLTDKRTGVSHDVRDDLLGDDAPLVYVARWPKERTPYVVAIRIAMPVRVTLWEVKGGRLVDVWETSGNPVLEYSPNLLGKPTILLGRSTTKLHLHRYIHEDRTVYECWTKSGRSMVMSRYAVWDEGRGYRLLPRRWGPKTKKRDPFFK